MTDREQEFVDKFNKLCEEGKNEEALVFWKTLSKDLKVEWVTVGSSWVIKASPVSALARIRRINPQIDENLRAVVKVQWEIETEELRKYHYVSPEQAKADRAYWSLEWPNVVWVPAL